jgi:DNA-binding protein H-NS
MADIDLSDLSLPELKKLQREVTKTIESYAARKRRDAIAAAEAAAKEKGFTLAELTGGVKKRRASAPPKYQHPENPDLTWSGRGRRPTWFKEAIEDGRSMSDFEIGA